MTLHTLHLRLHTPHFTLHTLHFTLYTLHSTLYSSHFTSGTVHFTLHNPHFTLYTVHTTFSTQHSTFFTLRALRCTTLHIPQSTMPCTVTGGNAQDCSDNLFHKNVLRDCIRVRGLHVVPARRRSLDLLTGSLMHSLICLILYSGGSSCA